VCKDRKEGLRNVEVYRWKMLPTSSYHLYHVSPHNLTKNQKEGELGAAWGEMWDNLRNCFILSLTVNF